MTAPDRRLRPGRAGRRRHRSDGQVCSIRSNGNFHEKTQIDSGVLSADTTLVMLTIGGNDARFDNKIQTCVIEGWPSEASMKADIDNAVSDTRTVLEQIHQKAPNASIHLMGYHCSSAARRHAPRW
ncbi:hypothetical protein ABZ611_10700 [Streptomyces sp. NPDC007861]|uniref:hypothetical protein n=1 Tax=Streptomyces sp. NPDC007861 TaxID=3154893 RepID=UPI0033DB95FA